MVWSINEISNQISNTEGAYTLTYSIDGNPTIKKHELSVNSGVTFKEVTPVGNNTGYSIKVEATSELKNCYIRCTDSEGNSQTSNLFTLQYVKETENKPPVISNIKISNINQSGVYKITYTATDDVAITNHLIKIDNEDFKEISPTKDGDTYSYDGTGLSNGTHICQLKVKDGTLETTSSVFQIIIPKIENFPPIITSVKVEETSYTGRYRISYSVEEKDKTDLIFHKLIIDNNEGFEIKPILVKNRFVYNGTGLEIGNHKGIVEVTDGTHAVRSSEFEIIINKRDGIGLKEELRISKGAYDTSYNSLMGTINEVIEGMKKIEDYDSNLGLEQINNSFKEYTSKTVAFKDVSQRAIDLISSNKTSDAKEDISKEIGDLTNSLGSLDQSLNDVFKDGILTETEKIAIKQRLQSLTLEKVDVDNQYQSILSKFNKTDLEYAEKGNAPDVEVGESTSKYPDKKWYLKVYNDFKSSYEEYSKKYEDLMLTIDYILKKEGILDSEDKDKKDKAFDAYVLAIGEYSKQASLAIEAIGRNETENNETLVQTFKGEYIRTNKENSAKLTELTQTTNGLTEKVSEFKQTADRIQLQVTENKNGLESQSSRIRQLADEISLKVSRGQVSSLIKQSSSEILFALNDHGYRGTWISFTNGYATFKNCYISCSAITSLPGEDPIIYLYGDKNKARCSIDATQTDEEGVGDAIRLKWDRSNYIRIAQNRISFYESGYGSGRSAIFAINTDGVFYKGKRIDNQTPSIPSMLTTLNSICKAQTGEWAQLSPRTDGKVFCGASGARWDTVFSKNGVKTSSDRREKEKISYIESGDLSNFGLIDDVDDIYDVSPKITDNDLYNFIKDDLHLATYRFKNSRNSPQDSRVGFIAQDIEHTKLGKYIIDGDSSKGDNLMVNQNNYINTIAGALKIAINKIEKLENKIEKTKGV